MKILVLFLCVLAAQAQQIVNGNRTFLGTVNTASSTGLIVRNGTTAPSSGDCDASGEKGNLYVRTGDQATVPTEVSVCTQIGASSWAWMPISHKVGTTTPATCTQGTVFFKTDATAGQNLYFCTTADNWTQMTGGSSSSTSTAFAPTRETGSAANDTLRLNCDTAPYCTETVNRVIAYNSTTDITFKISTSPSYTGNLYTYYTPSSQTVYCDQGSAGLTLTLAGCTAATTGGIPAGSFPVGKYNGTYAVVSNAFSDPSTSPVAPTVWGRTLSGAGVDCSDNGTTGEQTCVTDATIPSKTDVATNTLTYSTITGTTSLTLTTPHTISPLANGVCVYGRMGASNSTGTVTLSVNSATALPVYKLNGSSDASQVGSELRALTSYEFCYDGAISSGVWLVNVGGGGSSSAALRPSYWLPGGETEAVAGTPAAISPAANNTTYIAFTPQVAMEIRTIAFHVGTASGTCAGTCGMKIGIYDSTGAKVYETATITSGGSPDINSTGPKTVDFTATVSLTAGALYWVGFTSDSTSLGLYAYLGSASSGFGEVLIGALQSTAVGLGNSGSGTGGSVALNSAKGTVTSDSGKHIVFGFKY